LEEGFSYGSPSNVEPSYALHNRWKGVKNEIKEGLAKDILPVSFGFS